MIFTINGILEAPVLQNATEFFNSLKPRENCTVYLCTSGGQQNVTMALLNMINTHKDHVTLIGFGEICSNGMQLFFKAECKKELLPFTTGMYHLFYINDMTHYEGAVLKNNSFSAFMLRQKGNFSYLESLHKLVNFSKKELKDIKANQDVWFTYERMLDFYKFNTKQ